MEEVGAIDYAPRSIEQYTQEFFAHIREKDIERRKFKVVVDYAYGRISTVLPVILGRLGCEVISLNAYSDTKRAPKNASEREALIYNLSQVVTTLRADLGVLIHGDGERIALVDENGGCTHGRETPCHAVLNGIANAPGAKVAVPVTAPSVIEQVMRRTNGVVARTKTDARFLMTQASLPAEKIVMAGDLDGGFLFPELQPGFDGLFAFVKTLEMLSWLQRPLSEFAGELPPIMLAKATVRCPWDTKGSVMRQLTEESLADTAKRTDLVDGIKITEGEKEWALILPDAADPVFHVYAEGATQEKADERAAFYAAKIAAMLPG